MEGINIFYPIFLVLICAFQTIWLGAVGASTVMPDLVLILAFYCGARIKKNRGVLAASFAGFLQDCLSGGLLGINTLSKGLIGLLVSYVRKNIQVESFVPIAIFVACASLIDSLIFYFASTLFLDHKLNQSVFFNSILGFSIFNALVGPFVFYFLDLFQKRTTNRSLSEF